MRSTTPIPDGARRIRAAILATEETRAGARCLAHRSGAVEIVEVTSATALRDLARDGRIDLAVLGSVRDLGSSATTALKLIATLATANVRLAFESEGLEGVRCDALSALAVSFVERQRETNIARVRLGRAQARERGVGMGRPRRVIDVERARELLAQRQGLRQVALILGVSPRSLRRRLGSAC